MALEFVKDIEPQPRQHRPPTGGPRATPPRQAKATADPDRRQLNALALEKAREALADAQADVRALERLVARLGG